MLNSNDLIKKVKTYNKFFNPNTLEKAYDFALKAHEKQKRDEGSPYIIHPIAVANILTDLKLDSATIATGLLHDTIEDTHATYKTIEKEFGKEVADLVDGGTKISAYENQAASNSKDDRSMGGSGELCPQTLIEKFENIPNIFCHPVCFFVQPNFC